jgi:hypothetical protein
LKAGVTLLRPSEKRKEWFVWCKDDFVIKGARPFSDGLRRKMPGDEGGQRKRPSETDKPMFQTAFIEIKL